MKKDTEEYRAYRRNMYRLHHPVRAGKSQAITAYYNRSRASRLAEIARKQAIEDITDYVCKIYKVERRTAIAMLKDFFETE